MILIMIKIIFKEKSFQESQDYQQKIENLHFLTTNHMNKDRKHLLINSK